jgi:hypothetical protein
MLVAGRHFVLLLVLVVVGSPGPLLSLLWRGPFVGVGCSRGRRSGNIINCFRQSSIVELKRNGVKAIYMYVSPFVVENRDALGIGHDRMTPAHVTVHQIQNFRVTTGKYAHAQLGHTIHINDAAPWLKWRLTSFLADRRWIRGYFRPRRTWLRPEPPAAASQSCSCHDLPCH